jgi:hypothetical protein
VVKDTNLKWSRAFVQGYVCAVAEIVRLHGQETVARDVLKGLGKGVDWSGIDECDIETLRDASLIELDSGRPGKWKVIK